MSVRYFAGFFRVMQVDKQIAVFKSLDALLSFIEVCNG